MPISDIPILSMLRTKLHWSQERQRLLAQNVANVFKESVYSMMVSNPP